MTTKTAVNNAVQEKAKVSPEMRDKRAAAIAAMNLVTREGGKFKVGTPGLRKAFYDVWRDDAGKVRCNCLEFEENIGADAAFRCEHILAVKHSLLAKTTEPATQQPAPLKPILPSAESENENTQSGKRLNSNMEAESATENNKSAIRNSQSTIEKSSVSELELVESPAEAAEIGRTAVREALESRKNLANEAKQKTGIRQFADTLAKEKDTTDMNKPNLKTAASFAELENDENTQVQSAAPSNVIAMPFTQTLQALRQNVEPSNIKQREGWRDRNGNAHMVDYVEWHTVADILDSIAPHWSHSIRDIKQIGDSIAVTAAITIDGVTREGIGTGAADSEMGIKKAEHDALKRAAVKFGIARELYRRESDVIEREGANTPTNSGGFPSNPVAKTLADLVTPKQLGMIRALGRETNVEPDIECENVMSCKTDELSKKAASAFIQHLQTLSSNVQHEQIETTAPNRNGLRRVS